MPKLSELAESSRKTIMVYGNSGSGKTIFACGFPGPILVWDFDGKVSSAANFYRGTPQLDQIDYHPCAKKADFNKNFYTKLVELENLSKKPEPFPYKTIVLDSITTFVDALMAEVIKQNPGEASSRAHVDDTKVANQRDYLIAISHVKNTVTKILSLPANIVITGHMQSEKDELTGEILYAPLVFGKDLPKWFPVVFEEVYRTYVDEKVEGSKTVIQYMAQTRALKKYIARSQIQKLPNPVRLDYNEIAKFF